jgi:hypothetical protein
MALPAAEEDLQPLYKEIKSFLWTRTENDLVKQKRNDYQLALIKEGFKSHTRVRRRRASASTSYRNTFVKSTQISRHPTPKKLKKFSADQGDLTSPSTSTRWGHRNG